MARGTAYGWLDVPHVGERFNGTTDCYDPVEPTLYAREDASLYQIR